MNSKTTKTVLLAAAAALIATIAQAQDHSGHAGHKAAPAAASVEGVGVIRSLDAKAGKVVIDHEPIPPLNWPAMTMAFKADKASLAALKPGQKVRFQLQGQTITAIKPE